MRIAVLDDYQHVALDLGDWARLGSEVCVFDRPLPAIELPEILAPFDVVCLMRERTPFTAALIGALPRLRLIVTTGPRNLAIDVAAAAANGVTVCGTRSRKPATAQHAMTLILAATRGLVGEALSVRDGGWQRGLGRDLDGLTLGLLGLGKVGERVAALAKPFGMEIVAWSRNLMAARCADAGVRGAASLDDLLRAADVVSVHLVLSARTCGLIDTPQLACMKPDTVLVNTSRGPIVNTTAVLDALRGGRLGAAALDVFDEEPLRPDDPLRDRSLIDDGRLILTPHIGYISRQTYELFYSETVEAIEAWKRGRPIRVIEP